MASLRAEVLQMYRRIMRLSRTWKAVDPSLAADERVYIRDEARQMFRQHADVTDAVRIRGYLREAEARVEMALHYGNPFPRPVNLPPGALSEKPGKRSGRSQQRIKRQSRPLYVRSKDEDGGFT